MSNILRQIRECGTGLWMAEAADRKLRERIPKMRTQFEEKCSKQSKRPYWTGKYTNSPPRMRKYLLVFKKAEYLFKTDCDDPLTLHLPDGTKIQPKEEFWTDFGTIPVVLQLFFPKEEFARSYILHDSAHIDHALYVAASDEDTFEKERISWAEADQLLRYGVEAEGGNECKEWMIWVGVHSPIGYFGWIR